MDCIPEMRTLKNRVSYFKYGGPIKIAKLYYDQEYDKRIYAHIPEKYDVILSYNK